jgi:hypothetical protein
MDKQVLPGLKTLFIVHFIVGLIFGLVLLLIPELLGTMSGQPILEPIAYRMVGAAIVGISCSSILAYKQKLWDNVKIIVQMEIIWTIFFVAVSIFGLVTAQLPPMDWVNVIIVGGFGIAFAVYYTRQ